MTEEPIEVFFSYSHRDEEFKDELVKHLSILQRQHVVSGWHDRLIAAGTEWDREIDHRLSTADIILLMLSSDFLHSEYCWGMEVQKAMQRHEAGEAVVIPVVLRRVVWDGTPFAKLQALPKNAEPIANWNNRDDAFYDVARGIKVAVATLRQARRQEEEQQAAEQARLEAEKNRRQEERQAAEKARLEAEERKRHEDKEQQAELKLPEMERQKELNQQLEEERKKRLTVEQLNQQAIEWQKKLNQQLEEERKKRLTVEQLNQQAVEQKKKLNQQLEEERKKRLKVEQLNQQAVEQQKELNQQLEEERKKRLKVEQLNQQAVEQQKKLNQQLEEERKKKLTVEKSTREAAQILLEAVCFGVVTFNVFGSRDWLWQRTIDVWNQAPWVKKAESAKPSLQATLWKSNLQPSVSIPAAKPVDTSNCLLKPNADLCRFLYTKPTPFNSSK